MNLLLDSAVKATVILLAAWTASLMFRRASADVRYTIWRLAILTVAMLPAVLTISRSAMPSAARIILPVMLAGPQMTARKLPWLLFIWTAGVSIVLARLIFGLWTTARITRSARNIDGVLYSDLAVTPLTWGFLRPVVILPAYATQWTDADRDLVLGHERAHIARHDWLWQILSSITTAVFWFHPLMWLASIQLRREAESAVDDFVLLNGAPPSDYAERLLDVARRLNRISTPASVIPMVRTSELETRVQSILDPSRRRARAGSFVRLAIGSAAMALLVTIAATSQLVSAQGTIHKLTKDMTPPSVIYKEEPRYTPDAQAARIEGAVQLAAEVNSEGVAQNIRVTKSLGSGLDANAISAVSTWRFKPALKDGVPVTVAVTIEVNFRLK